MEQFYFCHVFLIRNVNFKNIKHTKLTTFHRDAFSIFFFNQKSSFHYIISRHLDGMVAIQDGAKFDSLSELIQYHTRHIGGLLTTLKVVCRRNPNQAPQGYRFISHDELQKTMREVALLLGYKVW